MSQVRVLTGEDLRAALDDVARLRIAVFKAFPYLYDGDLAYERDYLRAYLSPDAVVAVALDADGRIVGASTGAPMEDHAGDFGAAFSDRPEPLDQIFYCAESVLLPEYRGKGIGHAFFDAREDHARRIGRRYAAFCSVIRPADHPDRPADYRPLDAFWRKRGYAPLPGVVARFSWKDLGQAQPTEKSLQFWDARIVKIASAAYPLDWFADIADYRAKLTDWVKAADGADLLVFPEYGAMELASLGGRAVAGDLERSLHEVARHAPAVAALHEDLARQHRCHILAASGPVFTGPRPVNRAVLYGPNGVIGHQDKQIMTRFEREEWHVTAAPGLRVFDTELGRIAVLICYDAEFPLLGRALVEMGAELILVPSCTDTVAGFSRVRIGAMARALEGQCIVVQSPTVGPCDWSPAVDENRGRAAIYGPPDGFWPETGVIAEGAMDAPGWVMAEVDLSRVARSRREGAVLPFAHWPESDPPTRA